MSMMYNPEDLRKFVQEEQGKEQAKEASNTKSEIKKVADTAKKAVSNAQLAFECAQKNTFEIEELKKQLKRSKVTAIVAIIIAIICMAMTIAEGFSAMINSLP